MPYREKVAWLSLIAIAVAFIPYFTVMALAPPIGLPNLPTLWKLAGATTLQVLVLGAGTLFLRAKSPEECRAPADERDRTISQRSIGAAYGVMLTGMILVGCVMPFHSGGWELINAAVFMIVLAEVIHYGATIWGYRRGWHE